MKRQKFTEVDINFTIEGVVYKNPEYAKCLAEDIDNWISHFVGDEVISDKPTRNLIAAIESFTKGKITLRELEIQSDEAKDFLNN